MTKFFLCAMLIAGACVAGRPDVCEQEAKAVPACRLIAEAALRNGHEVTARGLYRMQPHGAILISADCPNETIAVRFASDVKIEPHAGRVLRKHANDDPFQRIPVVMIGTFMVAGREQCLGASCERYAIEVHEILCARRQ